MVDRHVGLDADLKTQLECPEADAQDAYGRLDAAVALRVVLVPVLGRYLMYMRVLSLIIFKLACTSACRDASLSALRIMRV